jgi:hypothetical protein
MSKKLEIKPVHLAFIGLAIIILGVLIPSFFISAFSTIGFAVIIGSLILLSAYAFFAVNVVKSKGKKTIKWLVLPVVLALLVVGGLYANNRYNHYLADKIYTVGDTIRIDDFDFKITNVSKDVLPFTTQGIDLTILNCDNIKYDSSFNGSTFVYDSSNPHEFYDSSDCSQYNSAREQAKQYVANYTARMTVSYQVAAKDTMYGKDLRIEVLPDSGRTVVSNAGAGSGDKQYSFMWSIGKKGYVANPASDFGGDLSKGLTHKGTVGFDLQKTEQTVDVIVKYHSQSRTIRITR